MTRIATLVYFTRSSEGQVEVSVSINEMKEFAQGQTLLKHSGQAFLPFRVPGLNANMACSSIVMFLDVLLDHRLIPQATMLAVTVSIVAGITRVESEFDVC